MMMLWRSQVKEHTKSCMRKIVLSRRYASIPLRNKIHEFIFFAFYDIMFLGFGYFKADWIQCEVSLPDES